MIAAVIALGCLAAVLTAALLARSGFRLRNPQPGDRRILVPFTGGTLDPTVLDAAIRLALAEDATLVPAYLLLVPLQYAEDSPLRDQVAVALSLLEAVEHAALRAGVPVDARIEKGRSPTHALRRLWDEEHFDRILAPAPNGRGSGFTAKDVSWILAHSPSETIILKPAPQLPPEERSMPASAHPAQRRRRLASVAGVVRVRPAG
jgi:Universal stress protein family